MAQAELKFPPKWFKAAHSDSTTDLFPKRHAAELLKAAAIVLVAAIAMAPSAFGQRGGGSSGGGGGSHASASPSGGGGSWGGPHSSGGFGGGGSHGGNVGERSGGNSGRGIGGRGSRKQNGSRGYAGGGAAEFQPFASREIGRVEQPRQTGFRAAFRRFFGITDSESRQGDSLADVDERAEDLVARDVQRASLPPVFGHLRLGEFGALGRVKSVRQAPEFAKPQADLRRRPMPPLPRRFGPVPVYAGWYGGYWPELDFGFPFFLGFDYLNYCGWFGCTQRNVPASPALLLYLTDGSALEVTDYWVDGVTMRYVTQDGKKGTVPVANIDIQRTTDADGRLGLKFRLDRTEPGLPLDRIEPSGVTDHESGLDASTRPQD